MPFKEIITVYFEHYAKHMNTLNVKAGVTYTVLQMNEMSVLWQVDW
jgi:hypothetical protein